MSMTARRMQMAASAGAAQSFTFVGVSYAISNLNIQVPSGTQEGDIAIAYSSTATGPAPTVYSGFTEIKSYNGTFEDMLQYKLLSASDLTTTFTRTADSYDAAIMFTFRPTNPITSINVTSINTSGQTSGTPSTQTLTTSTYDPPNILIATYSSYTAEPSIDGTFWNGNFLETGENNNRVKMYYEIQNDANTDRSVVASGDYGSYNIMMSCVINAS
jgi:hypothetical protein